MANAALHVFTQMRLLQELWISAKTRDEQRWVLRELDDHFEALRRLVDEEVAVRDEPKKPIDSAA